MSKFLKLVTVLSFAIVLGVGSAMAQSSSRLSANIPFEFSVGKKTYDAGQYQLKVNKNQSGAVAVTLVDDSGKALDTVVGTLNGNATTDGARLVFEAGNTVKVLSGIAMPISGISIPVSRAQRRLSVTVGKNETVFVPLASIN